MSVSSSDGGVDLDPVEVGNARIRVTRELELRGAGLVVTLRISPTEDVPIKYRVTDALAASFEVDDVGFHPAFEPSTGHIAAEEIVIEDIVEPGYAREIVWGICPTRPKPPEDVRRLHETVKPTVEHTERWVGEADGSNPRDETSSLEAQRMPNRGPASSIFARLKRQLWGEQSAPQNGTAAAESTADTERFGSEPRREEALTHLDDGFMNFEEDEGETPGSKRESANESGVNWAEFWGESTGHAPGTDHHDPQQTHADVDGWPNLEFNTETIRKANEEYRRFAELFDGIEPVATERNSNGTESAEPDVATQLIERFDDERPLENRRQLAEELLGETSQERLGVASLDNRLQALEAQLDELSDMTEVLAATIDSHRSAEADLDQITDELEELESTRRLVRRRIERATSERKSNQAQVLAVAERTKQLASTLDHLDEQVVALQSRNKRKFSDYETETSRVEAVGNAVSALESEVRSLRESLAE